MAEYDLVIRNGTVVTAADTQHCDIGVKDGVVTTLGRGLPAGMRDIDASGKLVLPGAIDSHCHIEQPSSAGVMTAARYGNGCRSRRAAPVFRRRRCRASRPAARGPASRPVPALRGR